MYKSLNIVVVVWGEIYIKQAKRIRKSQGEKGRVKGWVQDEAAWVRRGVCIYIGSPELLAWSKSKVLWVNVRCYSNEELWN